MTDQFATAFAWLGGRMKAQAAQTVSVHRGELSIDELSASIGRTEFEQQDVYGVLIEKTQSQDFILDAADYVFEEAAVEPADGDLIKWTQGETVHVYEVCPFGKEPSWRYTTSHRHRIRLHTKHIRTE